MAEDQPTVEEWRRLYEVAMRVKEVAPWEWMTEADVFGVQNPGTGEPGFVSVMGMAGEHFGISLYLGSEGLAGFAAVQTADLDASPEMVLEIPQLQASFEDRNTLDKRDREVIKKLELRLRGRNAWPMFRSMRPGFVPWHLESWEASFLGHALGQLLQVAARFRDDPSLLRRLDAERFLVRVPENRAATTWKDEFMRVPRPQGPQIPLCWDGEALEELKGLAPSEYRFEIDFFLMPTPIREKGMRPFFPYLLLVVDSKTGMIVGAKTLHVEESREEMWGQIPAEVVDLFHRFRVVPAEIRVRSDVVRSVLQPVAEELGFKIRRAGRLRQLDEAKEALFEQFAGHGPLG